MQQLQQAGESSLARILDKNQMKRLREISLQSAGPAAVLREDVVEKLEITPDQVTEIQQTVNESNQARRQLMARTSSSCVRSCPPHHPVTDRLRTMEQVTGKAEAEDVANRGKAARARRGAQAGQNA